MNVRKIVGSIVFGVILISAWQILYTAGTEWFGVIKSYAVPSPIGVWRSLIRLVTDGTLFAAVANSEYMCRNLKPVILGIQTLPSICWVPFAILWFGLGESAIIFVVVMGSAFSIALAVESGVKNVPPVYIKAAQTMGIGTFDLYRKVIFPAALPAFVSGLKQGWSFAWRALMSGEVMSASVGLGYTLILGRDLADINQVMTVMLVIIALGIIVDKGIFMQVENRMLRKRGLV